jgi:hypothetical protein
VHAATMRRRSSTCKPSEFKHIRACMHVSVSGYHQSNTSSMDALACALQRCWCCIHQCYTGNVHQCMLQDTCAVRTQCVQHRRRRTPAGTMQGAAFNQRIL